jgi:hypothetical protein
MGLAWRLPARNRKQRMNRSLDMAGVSSAAIEILQVADQKIYEFSFAAS